MTSTDISEQLSCILLAAGGSRRLGQPKALVEYDGESLAARGVRNLRRLDPVEVIVVTGSDKDNLLKEIEKYEFKAEHNEAWERGMGGSIATGVRGLSAHSAATLILLCDQWKVDLDDLARLVQAWQSDISGIFSAKWGDLDDGAFGPPVIFPKWLFSELAALDSEAGARQLIRKYWWRTTFVEMENAVFDLDDPGDLKVMRDVEATFQR